jgi:hypothetical protein
MRGSWRSARGPIVAPGASWRLDRERTGPNDRRESQTAVEMPAPWKPQTGFHRALEISQRARDSHIPTSRSWFVLRREEQEEQPMNVTLGVTARQTTVS